MCYMYAVRVQNLDVNMAVNNLLSRDDGEHEDHHDEPFQVMFSSGVYVCMHIFNHVCALRTFGLLSNGLG